MELCLLGLQRLWCVVLDVGHKRSVLRHRGAGVGSRGTHCAVVWISIDPDRNTERTSLENYLIVNWITDEGQISISKMSKSTMLF